MDQINPEVSSQSTEPTVEATEAQVSAPAKEEAVGSGIKAHIDSALSKVGKTSEQAAVEAAIEAYKPNFKFKAADKEYEFDEWVRPVIKNADHEKKLREIYEKAYGLDHVKSERDKFRTDYKTVNDQYSALNKGLDHLSSMLKNKDLHSFFSALKVPEQDVLQYALSRVQYSQLPPEQRMALDQQYEEKQKLSYYEQANQELIAAYQNQMVQQRTSELDGYLGRPEVAQIASAFDARVGRPGAFKDEVIKRGQYYASLPEPQDVTVEQAVREIMSFVGTAPQAQQAQGMQAEGEMNEGQQAVIQQNQKPVIPNIKGRGSSPAKKVVRSIEDIRNMSKSFQD